MTRRQTKALLLLGTLITAPLLMPVAAEAQTSAPARALAIPAQDLATALVTLAQQSGRNVLFAPDAVAGKRSGAVRGAASFDAALAQMLAGTGLAATVAGDGSVTVGAGTGADAAPVASEEIIVTAELFFRNRTNDPNPVLSYDYEYFQKFEPVSVGEMLKRVPGVTFTSDVLEYDGVQVRGLPSGYTQVLINGRRAPGGEADRSFFVDRIPAEIVERIEIVRAPRADQPSEGVAGTLNIVTKDSAGFEGGFAKLGALINGPDGAVRPSAAAAWAGSAGDTRFWVAGNYQGRRNPKEKVTDFFSGDFEEFEGRELQDDTRDGRDISLNGEVAMPIGEGKIRITGLYVDTDRDEDETSLTFEGGSIEELELDGVEIQRERIAQRTYAVQADGSYPIGAGELGFALGWSGFREDSTSEVDEGDDLIETELVERETLDIKDDEFGGTLSYAVPIGGIRAKAGIDILRKQRDGANRVFAIDGDEIEEETVPGAIFRITETRIDPYLRLTGDIAPGFGFDAGLRYEHTKRDVRSDDGSASLDAGTLNPSLHLRYAPGADGQLRFSVARTVRRPAYDLISPYRQEEEPADNDELLGNPDLRNETAWGLDLGYEHRIGKRGIIGANLFYRDITDVIELVSTGIETEAGGRVFQPQNIGKGTTWGIELDLSTDLDMLGLPDTGLFANYTYLDSEVVDPFTGETRRFNNQPQHIYNFGFIQNLRSPGISFGATVSGRSNATESNFDETVELIYGTDLEAFVEKRFGSRFVLRFTAANILDRRKRENFRIFDGDSVDEIIAARLAGDVGESEAESERAGVLFQVTLRAAF